MPSLALTLRQCARRWIRFCCARSLIAMLMITLVVGASAKAQVGLNDGQNLRLDCLIGQTTSAPSACQAVLSIHPNDALAARRLAQLQPPPVIVLPVALRTPMRPLRAKKKRSNRSITQNHSRSKRVTPTPASKHSIKATPSTVSKRQVKQPVGEPNRPAAPVVTSDGPQQIALVSEFDVNYNELGSDWPDDKFLASHTALHPSKITAVRPLKVNESSNPLGNKSSLTPLTVDGVGLDDDQLILPVASSRVFAAQDEGPESAPSHAPLTVVGDEQSTRARQLFDQSMFR